MSNKPIILCIDDEEFNQTLVQEALSDNYDIRTANDGVMALAKIASERPALVIMDVEMPVMNGYECCRQIKADEALSDIPVLFLSARDAIEDRLQGFEVGGDDYLTKPFNFQLLASKIKALLALSDERHALKDTLNYASKAAMSAMSSMSELGCVLEGMKNFNTSPDITSLAEAILACLANFGLDGAVQLRTEQTTFTLTNKGPASPLDISIINHMAEMNRIEQFKSRLSVSYPHITILVTNMPVEDRDRCGRLRDHLAMITQAADVRVQGISALLQTTQRGQLLNQLFIEISDTLTEIDRAQRDNKATTTVAIHGVTMKVQKALLEVEISHAQETYLTDVVRQGLEHIAQLQTVDLDVQNKLSTIISRLKNTTQEVA